MAVRKSSEPIQKHTLNLFAGDYERLQILYPQRGAGWAIRELVRAHLINIEKIAGTDQWQTSQNFTLEIPSLLPEKI